MDGLRIGVIDGGDIDQDLSVGLLQVRLGQAFEWTRFIDGMNNDPV